MIYGTTDKNTIFNYAVFGNNATNGDLFQHLWKVPNNPAEVKLEYKDDEGDNFTYDISNASYVQFNNTDLSGYNFSKLGLVGNSFKHTDLTGANFKECVIVDVDFTGSDLKNVDFSGAIMHNVNFSDCNFDNTIFHSVKNLYGDVVVESTIENQLIEGLIMPLGFNYTPNESYTDASMPPSTDYIKNVTTFDYSLENNVKRLAAGQDYSKLKEFNGGNELYNLVNADLSNVFQTVDGQKFEKWELSDFSGVNLSNSNMESSVFAVNRANEPLSFVKLI